MVDWHVEVCREEMDDEALAKAVLQELAGNILGKVRSSSGDDIYEIRRGRDGVTYCTCPGWRFSRERPKTCVHLRDYFAII